MFHRRTKREAAVARRERGYIAVLAALLMIPLIGMLAACRSTARLLMAERRKVQATADACAPRGGRRGLQGPLRPAPRPTTRRPRTSPRRSPPRTATPTTASTRSSRTPRCRGPGGSASVTVTSNLPKFFSAPSGAAARSRCAASSKAQWPARTTSQGVVDPPRRRRSSPSRQPRRRPGASRSSAWHWLVTSAPWSRSTRRSTGLPDDQQQRQGDGLGLRHLRQLQAGRLLEPLKGSIVTGAKYVADPLATLAAPTTAGLYPPARPAR